MNVLMISPGFPAEIVDAAAGSANQDAKIAGMIHDQGKGVVVIFNKWDLVSKETNTHNEHWEKFCQDVPFLTYAPWFMISALTKQRTGRIMEKVWEVHENRQKRVSTSEVNAVMERIVSFQQPRAHGGGVGKIYYTTQIESAPPTFLMSVNEPKFFARNYLRFINNQLRKEYGFTGSRIFVKMKKH